MYQGVLLIQRPPVVKHLAAAVSLLREEWVSPHLFVAHPLEPLLTLAVLGIFDVLACVQEGPAPKAPIHIAPVGRVAGELDDGQPAVQLLLPFPAAVLPAGLPLAACRFLRIHQERRDLSLNRWFNFLNLLIMSTLAALHQFSFCREFRTDAIGCRRKDAAEPPHISVLDDIVMFQELLGLFPAFCGFIFVQTMTNIVAAHGEHLLPKAIIAPKAPYNNDAIKTPRSAVPPS